MVEVSYLSYFTSTLIKKMFCFYYSVTHPNQMLATVGLWHTFIHFHTSYNQFIYIYVIAGIRLVGLYKLRFRQFLWMISGHFFCQKINWNRAWHVIYGWKELPVGNKFCYSYKESVHENMKIFEKIIFFKQRWRCVKQHCAISYTHISIK